MRRLRHKEGYVFLLFFLLAALFCLVFVLRFGVFGAEVDWFSQHSVLPDYFRRQFYETGELFPEFAMNIGGGQNIYYFSYYGLYSPIILLSYLLPFVKMSSYVMAAGFFCLVFSVVLMYRWLRGQNISERTAGGVSVLFLLAGPMIFHAYHQIMFVNYMPFLCMGFLGVDEYFKGKKRLLVISIFLMILTSFFFSIGGLLALILYGLHRYLEGLGRRGEKVKLRGFLTEGVRFLAPFVTGIMMSGILLAPTALALTGRGSGGGGNEVGGSVSGDVLSTLLCPQAPVKRFLYSPYGIGLTTLSITALAALLLFSKLYDRVLAWCCAAVFTVPAFAYLLNGGLYIRDKVMIPFLPLMCYMTACYLRELEEGAGVKGWKMGSDCLPYLVSILLAFFGKKQGSAGEFQELMVLDGAVMLICFMLFRKRRNVLFLLVPSIVFLILSGTAVNSKDGGPVDREFYTEMTDSDIGELIKEGLKGEEGFYRTEQLGNEKEDAVNLNRIWDMNQYVSSYYSSSFHSGYERFRRKVFQTEEPYRNFLMQPALHNPVFLRFMGVKYVVSKEEVPGYTPVGKKGKWKLCENTDASPIAYATDKVMPQETYEKLEYPYNQLALLTYAVVKESPEKEEKFRTRTDGEAAGSIESMYELKEVKPELPEHIQADTNQTVDIDIPDAGKQSGEEDDASEKILFLQFEVENLKPSEDVAVWAEGIRNKLTSRKHFYYNGNTRFNYTVPLKKGQKKAELVFGKGDYKIKEVKCFTGVLGKSSGESLYQSEFFPDSKSTGGNVIKGRIEAHSSGRFITTIPYDENFEIRVDGKKVSGECVNTAFLGFRLAEGEHEIEIVYHAPGASAGRAISAAGLLIFLLFFFRRREKA